MKKIVSIVLVLACLLSLVACGAKEAGQKVAVCFVVANTANSEGLNFNSPLVQDTVYCTIRKYGFIGAVNADGDPDLIISSDFDIDDSYKSASDEKLEMEARAKATNVLLTMQNAVADDPEVDYLESLRLAVRTLSSLQGYDSKMIILMGTGLSTTGVMNFCNNLISADAQTIVDLLKERSEIPDFTGITVYSQQLGDVALPQADLTSAQRKKLGEIYGTLVEAGGGTFVYNETVSNPVDTGKDYPAVTPVVLPSDTPIAFEETAFEGDNILQEPIFLTEEKVKFVKDEDVFLNPDEASETLKPISDYLINNPSVRVLLAGTTAGDTDSDFTLTLSKQRAETVKKCLIEQGVNAANITTVGLGSEKDPWHISNVGYDAQEASLNRKVVLLDASSQRATSILTESGY